MYFEIFGLEEDKTDGIFSFPAVQISSNDIYALEISDSMIELLESRKVERNTQNLKIKKVDSAKLPIDSSICDMAIMVTVLHEIEDKQFVLNEIKRVLKAKGKLLIIEFHKRKTPMVRRSIIGYLKSI